MKLVCLLPVSTDARIQRRLGALRRHGIDPEVLAFERPQYPGRPPSKAYQSLGVISHGRYVRRLGAIVRALPLVRSACVGADVNDVRAGLRMSAARRQRLSTAGSVRRHLAWESQAATIGRLAMIASNGERLGPISK